jgi:hypothetical protein
MQYRRLVQVRQRNHVIIHSFGQLAFREGGVGQLDSLVLRFAPFVGGGVLEHFGSVRIERGRSDERPLERFSLVVAGEEFEGQGGIVAGGDFGEDPGVFSGGLIGPYFGACFHLLPVGYRRALYGRESLGCWTGLPDDEEKCGDSLVRSRAVVDVLPLREPAEQGRTIPDEFH